jgi:prepilin-type processing-associated H-X9-DG protein
MTDLVVTLALLGLSLGVLLPTMQRLRETAHRQACANHLRLIGQAIACHRAEHVNFFPTGGGEAFCGAPMPRTLRPTGLPAVGVQQDWGWMYQILPYLGCDDIWSLPRGQDEQIMRTAIAPFFCPSRRSPMVVNNAGKVTQFYGVQAVNDYAGNMGAFTVMEPIQPNTGDCLNAIPGAAASHALFRTGIFVKTRFLEKGDGKPISMDAPIGPNHVVDGLSHTLMVSEKRVRTPLIGRPQEGDRLGYANGFGIDTLRSGARQPRRDAANLEEVIGDGFGAAHPTGMNTLFADGSLRFMRYDLSPDPQPVQIWESMMELAGIAKLDRPPNAIAMTLLQRLCHRNDGLVSDVERLE